MTEQELRDKIVEILRYHRDDFIEENYRRDIERIDFYALADALIAAGIGDVSKYKHRSEAEEKNNIKYGRVLYNLAVKYISAAKIYTITADDGKKYLAKKDICALSDIKEELMQAEKELQEERKDD